RPRDEASGAGRRKTDRRLRDGHARQRDVHAKEPASLAPGDRLEVAEDAEHRFVLLEHERAERRDPAVERLAREHAEEEAAEAATVMGVDDANGGLGNARFVAQAHTP